MRPRDIRFRKLVERDPTRALSIALREAGLVPYLRPEYVEECRRRLAADPAP